MNNDLAAHGYSKSWTRAIVMGCMLLALLQPSLFSSNDSSEPFPLPLTSSVLFEHYGDGDLYKTHFEAPYNQYPCQPRKIHLSPTSDVDPESNLFNATVTFTLDTNSISNSNEEKEGDLRTTTTTATTNMVTSVTYGRGNTTEGSVVIHYDKDDNNANDKDDHDANANNNNVHDYDYDNEDYTIIRFNYTSPETGEYYRSDLIHHVLLKDLKAGRERYWYRIRVELVGELLLPTTHKKSVVSSVHFLLPSPERGFVSQDPIFHDHFFLRGSYSRGEQEIEWGEASSILASPEEQPQQDGNGKAAVVGETPVYEFTTPPLYGRPTSIALVGDLGQTKNSTRTMARILDAARRVDNHEYLYEYNNPDAKDFVDPEDRLVTNLFIAGDLSYSDGDPQRWESWLDLAEPLLREIPFASIPGNHEIECDKATRETFVPYESFFRNPNRIADAIMVPPSEDYTKHHYCTTPSEFLEGHYDYGNSYYSYKQGLVHTIFLNSYTSLLEGSRQRKWLVETALPLVDRSLTPWLVVIFHTPLYTTFLNHVHELNPNVMKQSGLREVFQDYKVNLVVSGHDHAYLRTKALDPKGSVATDEDAPVFWTLGAGGNREGHSKYINPFWAEHWVAKRDNDEFGFGLFFAPNRTHAHLQWIRDDDNNGFNANVDSDSSTSLVVMRDSVWIKNYFYSNDKDGDTTTTSKAL